MKKNSNFQAGSYSLSDIKNKNKKRGLEKLAV
jgi:hypothetical protein